MRLPIARSERAIYCVPKRRAVTGPHRAPAQCFPQPVIADASSVRRILAIGKLTPRGAYGNVAVGRQLRRAAVIPFAEECEMPQVRFRFPPRA
jgi:hypothetical protein